MAELTVGGKRYATSTKLDAFVQLHIARKLGPALPIVEGLVDPANVAKDKSVLTLLMFSHISDTDTEFIIRKCLSVVQRRQEDGKPVKIQAPDGSLMFDDIPLADLLTLTVAVVDENLGDFFRTALDSIAKQGKAE